MKKLFVSAALVSLLASASPAAAGPSGGGYLPSCDDALVLSRIRYTFAHKEWRFWSSPLRIVGFDRIRETAFRPWALETIPRRWCSGRALVSDGKVRPVHYAIGANLGMAGVLPGVTWCVVGLDRNWAYNPDCRTARP